MNRYQTIVNKIKNQFSHNWLTPSQQEVMNIIMTKFQTHKVINIYGEAGSGKTFLAWVLEKSGNAQVIDGYESTLPNGSNRVVIDNGPIERYTCRLIRDEMVSSDIKQVVILTRKPIDDYIPKLELHITDEDKDTVKHNLYLYCDLQILNENENRNIHELIINNL